MAHLTRWFAAACAPLASLLLAAGALADDGVRGAPAIIRPAPEVCPGERQLPTARTLDVARAATLCLLNRERTSRGLAPLSERVPITQQSQAYSEWMAADRFFAHSPVGYLLMGAHWIVGQNLAWADGLIAAPGRVVAAWMASPGHRANILNPEATDVGIGIALVSPDWRARLPAAVYTTDFGAIVEVAVVTTRPLLVRQPAPTPRAKKPLKRKACRTAVRKAKRSRCTRRGQRVQRRPPGRQAPETVQRRPPGRQAPETLPYDLALLGALAPDRRSTAVRTTPSRARSSRAEYRGTQGGNV